MTRSTRDVATDLTGNDRTASEWIEQFEIALRQMGPIEVSTFFPDADHPEFAAIVSEILRILLEWRWGLGERDGLERLLAEENLKDILNNRKILSPVAFEDYRLRVSEGHSLDRREYQQRYGLDVSEWGLWLENGDEEVVEAYVSTASGRRRTVGPGTSESFGEDSDALNGYRAERVVLPESGSRIGDFELVRQIGAGAFSRVFIARQYSLARRQIVVKITLTPLGESQQLARLQHGNIMPLYFAEYIDGLYVLGMPLLGLITLKHVIDDQFDPNRPAAEGPRSGQSLANLIREDLMTFRDQAAETDLPCAALDSPDDLLSINFERMSWEKCVLTMGQRLADALHFSHVRGVQHRDLKPANILLGFDGQPMLLDFNLSRLASESGPKRARAVGGTLPYMAPEHLESMDTGIDRFTRASDVYSLGVVLYEALTGHLPHDPSMFSNGNLPAAIEARRQPIKNPRALAPEVQPASASIILKCLEHDPEKRYSSAGELAKDLGLQLADRPLRIATNPSWLERAGKFRRRHHRIFSVASLVALAVFMGIAAMIASWSWHQSSQKTIANERYQRFVKQAHLAEAELFFADGGSREHGRKLAEETLAIFEFDGGETTTASSALHWLSPSRQKEVMGTANFLNRLATEDSPIPATPQQTTAATTELELAFDAFSERDYATAITILDRELEKSYQRFAAWFLKGKCYYEQRQYRDAERCFAVAGMVDPDSLMAMVARGICHFQMNQFDDAKRFFESAVSLKDDHFAANYNLALVDERQHEFQSALKRLRRAEVIQPNSTRVQMARSRIARAMGNDKLADEALNQVISQEPTEPEGWILRGLARLSQSPVDAIQDFEKAEQWNTTRFVAGQNRAHVLSEYLKRPEEAIEVLSRLVEEDPRFIPALSGRAVLYARSGNREAALADVESCKKLPLTPQLHYQLACVYALLAKNDYQLRQNALRHLAIATAPAYGSKIIATDTDLRNLEESKEFQAISNGISAGNRLQTSIR